MKYFANLYQKDITNLLKSLIPPSASYSYAESKNGQYKSDYIIYSSSFSYMNDVQHEFSQINRKISNNTKIVIIYFNFFWKPILNFASKIGIRRQDVREPNWMTNEDIKNILDLADFEEVKKGKRLLVPLELGIISTVINKYIGQLPIINNFCLIQYQVFKKKKSHNDVTVSVVIPARNEEENIKGVLKKIPKMGKKTEIIFVEGNSTDNTWNAIREEVQRNKTSHKATFYKQKGKGKADAVRLGFSKSSGDILMILDADLTVPPKDLPKFYRALINDQCEFANGCRLIYPMEKQAMRTLNYWGNTFFSIAFSYLLGQRTKDTLCGTKVLWKDDYRKIIQVRKKKLGDFDPFGDFDLLFGASCLNLKIRDIPITYKERVYGTTNIHRFRHGIILLKMTLFAAKKLKFV